MSRPLTRAGRSNVVWASDTNYRISLPNEDIRRLVDEDDFGSLIAADQVSRSLRLPSESLTVVVASDGDEDETCFRRICRGTAIVPTYVQVSLSRIDPETVAHLSCDRYDNGTEIYDSSEKNRAPAWTGESLLSDTKCVMLTRPSARSNPLLRSRCESNLFQNCFPC